MAYDKPAAEELAAQAKASPIFQAVQQVPVVGPAAQGVQALSRSVTGPAPTMRYDTEGRTEPLREKMGWGERVMGALGLAMPAMMTGNASQFAKIVSPKMWAQMHRQPDIYNAEWAALSPGVRGNAQATPVFRSSPNAPFTGGTIKLDPWTILDDWSVPNTTGMSSLGLGPSSTRHPNAQEVPAHEMGHLWLSRIHPVQAGLPPRSMVELFEKQQPGVTAGPLKTGLSLTPAKSSENRAHNVVYELARRTQEKGPAFNQEAALSELGKGTTGLPIGPRVLLNYTTANPFGNIDRDTIREWLLRKARSGQ